MTRQIDRAGSVVALSLRLLPAAGEPGHRSAGEIAAGLAIILRARLGPCERLTVASAGMLSIDCDTAEELAEATLYDARVGEPVSDPLFTPLREEARGWATFASRGELKAYLGAIWGRLPETERTSFLSAVRPKRRAA